MPDAPSIFVAAVVPFSADGGDDVLLVRNEDAYMLPMGGLRRSERALEAAGRIVQETAGLQVSSVRVLYLLEDAGSRVILGVLCEALVSENDEADLRGEIVSLTRLEHDFQPLALLEILVEDLRSGFIRPVAHVVESTGAEGQHMHVTW